MSDRSLFLDDRTKLSWMPKKHTYYLNKTTVVYGRTGSGKSTIIEEVMYLCKDYIPTVFVVAPTNASNNAYTDKIPSQFIRKDLDLEWLEKLLERQKNSANIYHNANKLEVLKSLFNRISDETSQALEKSIINKAHASIVAIGESEMKFAHKKKQKSQILDDKNNMLRKLYKTTIRYNKIALEQEDTLHETEQAALSFLDFNPNVMFILDDCASKFKKLCKKSSAVKEIFYEGRHYFFTTVISTQDDKEVDSELRKNTRVSIFTTAQAGTSNFDRASNGYPKHEKLRARMCIETVFKQDENDAEHHQKLVYLQGDADPFRYTIADLYDDFKMGSDPMWKYSERLKSRKNNLSKNNSLFNKYA